LAKDDPEEDPIIKKKLLLSRRTGGHKQVLKPLHREDHSEKGGRNSSFREGSASHKLRDDSPRLRRLLREFCKISKRTAKDLISRKRKSSGEGGSLRANVDLFPTARRKPPQKGGDGSISSSKKKIFGTGETRKRSLECPRKRTVMICGGKCCPRSPVTRREGLPYRSSGTSARGASS